MSSQDWFAAIQLPVQGWSDHLVMWLAQNWRPAFQAIRGPLVAAIEGLSGLLAVAPPPLVLVLLFLLAWQIGSLRSAVVSTLLMFAVGMIGVWTDAMRTLALVLVAVGLCMVLGFPLGILAARSERLERGLKPLLDLMQTLPAFVYLVPIVLLFGIGDLSGVLVTAVFAVPPLIRLTSLGIRGVPPPMIEAAVALGATPWQVLRKVSLPMALPAILTGINQTIMMALAMVTYASMIGVGGLGQLVLRGIGRLDMGLAMVGGAGIVALAVVLTDLVQPRGTVPGVRPPPRSTPIGLVRAALRRLRPAVPAPGAQPAGQLSD
ncbi:ABC transporter permease subunit [Azospirillum sp. RWY-5-1]|uniref:ABC transporter permease subunit n=1 Tax=Azospirillum oleiclasticum TaxID=2735135 RepID=A0ABX2TAD9_9PROT|nr:ABC transporter permease subunit [Azospirillum oleiclasticum]NYZ17673.1 ABC transporter permease subunit [Azospirillum oleiclasticum]NYZ21151.1 ABC transporter permease subunit [Azospirillum oleiclasticum]